MKKNNIIIIVLILCIAVIAGTVYHHMNKPTLESKYVIDLLNGLNTSIIKDENKEFELRFKQKYNFKSNKEDDSDSNKFSIDYDAEGAVLVLYNLPKEEKLKNFDIVKIMKKGDGYIIGTKLENYNYHNEEKSKKNKDDESNIMDQNSTQASFYTLSVDDKDLYVTSKNFYVDNLDPTKNKNDEFKALIEKKLINNNVSDNIINNSISKIVYMDAFDFISVIDNRANKLLNDKKFNKTTKLNSFAKNNNLKIEEKKNKIVIKFSLNTKEWFKNIKLGKGKDIPRIKGKMEIDKKTKRMINFKYDLKDYLLSILNKEKKESNDFSAKVDDFTVEGKMSKKSTYKVTIDDDAVKYDSESLDEFIKKFRENLIEYY